MGWQVRKGGMTSVSVQHSEILGIATPGSRAFRVGRWRVEPGLGRISAGAIELGPHRGHKAFMLQTLPLCGPTRGSHRAAFAHRAGRGALYAQDLSLIHISEPTRLLSIS